MVERSQILSAVKEALEASPDRNFRERVDITINLRNIDMSQPKNRIDETIQLPNGIGTERKVAVLGKGEITTEAKNAGVELIISPEEIERLGEEPREARKIANEYDFFLAETTVMPLVGRWLGPRLGPRGKMPLPIPPGTNITPIVQRLRNSVKIRTRDKKVFHAPVGTRDMDPGQIAENIDVILRKVESTLESGMMNVRSVYVKTTMGPAVRVV